MKIWDLCIQRPVFTLMLVSAPVILGIASYFRLGVELFPNVDVPFVTVTTTLRGASVEEMESSVTKVIEEAVNSVSGIDTLRSTTKEGFSQVMIEFKLEKDGDVAAQEVDAKVRTIVGRLPIGTDPPIIDKLAVDAVPVLTLAISGRRDLREVTEITRKRIKENLETLSGVGSVVLVGGRTRAIQIILEPNKLLKYDNLTVTDIRDALIRENQEQPGGRVDRGLSERIMRTLGRVEKPEEFADLIVGNQGGQPVRIAQLGRVDDGYEEPRGLSRLWVRGEMPDQAPGANSVSLVIQKQSGANTVEVVDRILARLDELKTGLPTDLRVEVIRDQSRFIRNSMDEVKVHLVLAAILVVLSILLFLRDWRTTLIATVAIPTSMIGSFACMDWMGFSINNFTMLGLILAVGIVVDDAVVVHENIFRHMEEKGLSAWQAASTATREIALAVLATTLSLVVVFAPIAFMGGQVGRFLSCFGWVVGFSVLLSMFVSFTLTPMLCARFLKPPAAGEGSSKSGLAWQVIEGSYLGMLGWSLKHRWAIVLLALGILMLTPKLFETAGSDFVPKDDQSEFEVALSLPEGYSLDRADQVLTELDLRLRQLRGVTHTFYTIGDTSGRVAKGQGDVTTALIYVRLVPIGARDYSQFDVMRDARVIMVDYPDLRSAVQTVEPITAAGIKQVDLDFNLIGPDMEQLRAFGNEIAEWLRNQSGYVDVDTSLSLSKPELWVKPDRERMSDLGVSLEDIALTTRILVGGEPVSKFKEGDEQYDIWLRAERSERNDPIEIAQIGVPASRVPNGVARLGNLVDFEQNLGPNAIDRFSRQRQVAIAANLQGKDIGTAVEEILTHVQKMNLPPEYRYEFIGDAKMLEESNANFALGFMLAFVFMYMILAAQFESLVHPVAILAALPLTIPFAVLSLILMQTSLDVFAMLGLFMLFGIVKKNGILQIDYTNQLRAQGLDRDTAIMQANRVRLRPILMTTVMLVAAMIPMALGTGPGAGTRASMAKVILGGQALSLLLALLITPVAYSMFDAFGSSFRRRSTPVQPNS